MKKPPSKETMAALLKARELHKTGKYDEAEEVYRALIKHDPNNSAALFSLGLALQQRGGTSEPVELYRRVIRQEPHNPFALSALASLLIDLGERGEALELAQRAKKAKPPAPILNSLGVFYRDAGMKKEALECFDAAIAGDANYATPYYNMLGLRIFTASDIATMQKIPVQSHDQRIHLEFALARACLDTGDAENAFKHYAEANKLKKSRYAFTMDEVEHYLGSVINLFSEARVKKLLGKGTNTSAQPVFIVGMPRSGSTLVDQIIASHPDAKSVGEVRFLEKSIPLYPNLAAPAVNDIPMVSQQMMDALNGGTLDAIAEKYLAQTAPYAHGAKRVVDKTLFNYQWVGIIRLALPHAKIIHCTRDPRDMGLSIWQTSFAEGIVKWAYDMEDIGRYYHIYRKMMAHWDRVFPGDIFEANYEKIVADQEGETRKLLAHIGLPFDERCLKFHETERVVKTASTEQVRRPLYGDSVAKWKKYENYLAPLLETLEKP